ncbi:hypothetical protein TGMAS_274100 [Toxoplasma gondii MAS]|uniref:Transmembrane protein n=1 Tax=Toxoplasma gondii MAS TaxID=943118 RepID=A0A086QX13_TOXGO|nr:hypothetical protein TGMAS_274100 [Toxoplasma gondii MAS]
MMVAVTPCLSVMSPFLTAQCCRQERNYAWKQRTYPFVVPSLTVETCPTASRFASLEACSKRSKHSLSSAPRLRGGTSSSELRFSWGSRRNVGAFAALRRQPSSCNSLPGGLRHRQTSNSAGDSSLTSSVLGSSYFDLGHRRLISSAYLSPLYDGDFLPSYAYTLPSPSSVNPLFGTPPSLHSSRVRKAHSPSYVSRNQSQRREDFELVASLPFRPRRRVSSGSLLVACASPTDSQEKPQPPRRFHEPVLAVDFPETFLPQKTFGKQAPVPHDCVAVAPRCMHDICWIPAARAYAVAVYVNRDSLEGWKEWYTQRRHATEKGLKAEEEQEALSLLFAPEIEKTLVFTFVGNKNPEHILKGFHRALANSVPRNMDAGCKDALYKEVQAFIQALRSCTFKPSCSLAVTVLPTEALTYAAPGSKAIESSTGGAEKPEHSVPPEGVNDSRATIVLMYKEANDNSFKLLASFSSRFLSLALHNLYLDGWGAPEPRYQSISKKFREGARKAFQEMKEK